MRESSVPRNKMGLQAPHDGKGYCGIYCSQEHYREYLQTELREPLQAGIRYRLTFWVSLADKSPQAIASLGGLLTTERPSDTSWRPLMRREKVSVDDAMQEISTYYEPQVGGTTEILFDAMRTWQPVSGIFTAQGGERFLTIGNFASFNRSRVVPLDNANAVLQGAYYYVDDVSLVAVDTLVPPALPSAAPATLARGVKVRMEGVFFASGQSEILQQSYRALSQLLTLLTDHPSLHIEIQGHTDDQGTVAYNQRLSEARAQAVVDYLVAHGIDRRRLSWRGFGESNPVDSNDTDNGRRHNRRVEWLVTAE
jgi:outer membrane protein OmpA-like peptidoglycan-associated protein